MPAVMLLTFALTLFLSACLMFIIEMMVGKMMLPLMGGTPAVWNTCMVFYQAILLAGYGFAHASIKWLGPRGQSRLQLFIIAMPFLSFILNLALAANFLAPYPGMVAGQEGNPIPILLTVLTISIGLPMLVICTSAPVLTRWFSSTDHPSAQDPYFLYGASNFGSMLALLGYPAFIEPTFSLAQQQLLWVIGFGLLAVLVCVCAYMMWKSKAGGKQLATVQIPERVWDVVGLALFVLGVGVNLYYFLGKPETSNFLNAIYGMGGAALWVIGFCMFRGRFLRGHSHAWNTVAEFVSVADPNAKAPSAPRPAPTTQPAHQLATTAVKAGPVRTVTRDKAAIVKTAPAPAPAAPAAAPLNAPLASQGPSHEPVTWERRIRWIALAMVPSSLMLGVTTYITTDIAAISYLWVLPLSLYLLTFIIVFATISPRTQNVVTFAGVVQLALIGALFAIPFFFESEAIHFLFFILALGGMVAGVFILRMTDVKLVHRAMIITMPLLLLLMLFMTLSEIKPDLMINILLHLGSLFIITMVCHGELALDRPEPKHLTEFFLLMSLGGVLGGMFNGLLAPMIFNSLAEYQLMMVVSCLLLPALGRGVESGWARWVDVALGGTILLIGLVLVIVTFGSKRPDLQMVILLGLMGSAILAGVIAGAVWIIQKQGLVSWVEPVAAVGVGTLVSIVMFLFIQRDMDLKGGTTVSILAILLAAGVLSAWVLHLAARQKKLLANSDWVVPCLLMIPVYCCLGAVVYACTISFSLTREVKGRDGIMRPQQIFDPKPFTEDGAIVWGIVALVVAVLIWLPTAIRRFRQPAEPDGERVLDYRLSAALDLAMPLALFILVVGLFWGLPSPLIQPRIESIAKYLNDRKMAIKTEHLMGVLRFGLPAVLCYTFVERWKRFGLGVGALLLAAGYCMMLQEAVMFQDRSFFGVLKVEDSYSRYPEDNNKKRDDEFPLWAVHRLVHGTTLHGKQFLNQPIYTGGPDVDVRDTPLSYYHRTGPVGHVFRLFNDDPKRKVAVIGLGTGTMATYGLKGQRMDVYDIDPKVVAISYDSNEFFYFVEDAEDRDKDGVQHGAHIGLILGDARLTFDPREWRDRQKISADPGDKKLPPIDSKVTQKRMLPLHSRYWHRVSPEQWHDKMDVKRNEKGGRDEKNGKKDGLVDFDEWSLFSGTRAEFDEIDALVEKDGKISLEEARKVKVPERKYGEPLTAEDKYRLIVVDAFSSDAIPIHLITRQALQIYLDRMEQDAVLCIHISNRYLDLHPVLANIATELGLYGLHMSDDENDAPGKSRSHWVMLSREQKVLDQLSGVARWRVDAEQCSMLAGGLFPLSGARQNFLGSLYFAAVTLTEIQDNLAKLELLDLPAPPPPEPEPVWDKDEKKREEQQRQYDAKRKEQEEKHVQARWKVAVELTNRHTLVETRDDTPRQKEEKQKKREELRPYLKAAEGYTQWEPLDTTEYLRDLAKNNRAEINRLQPMLSRHHRKAKELVNVLSKEADKVWEMMDLSRPQDEGGKEEAKKVAESLRKVKDEYEERGRLLQDEYSQRYKRLEIDYEQGQKKVRTEQEKETKRVLYNIRRDLLREEIEAQQANELQRYVLQRMTIWLAPEKKLSEDFANVKAQLVATPGDLNLQGELKRLTREKEKYERPKGIWDAAKSEFDAKKVWLDRLANRITEVIRQLTARADRAPEKLRTNERVGVWTDDYSNLLSVFNWGGEKLEFSLSTSTLLMMLSVPLLALVLGMGVWYFSRK